MRPLSPESLRDDVPDGRCRSAFLPEAFAVVREAAVRTVGMRHFDVQLLGGMVLHQGRIAETHNSESGNL